MSNFQKGNATIVGIVVLLLVIIGIFVFTGGSEENLATEGDNVTGEAMMEGDKMEAMEDNRMVEDDSMTKGESAETEQKEDGSMIMEGEVMSKGSYENYSPEKIASAAAGDGKALLFFHASWCPTCRALNSDIEKNAAAIPTGVTILKTDYDKEGELKKKYGVTTQHTLVQVDSEGNLVKKWTGSRTLAALIDNIQ